MTPSRRKSKLSIAVPASLVGEYANLRDKTEVIGRVARSAAIFRAEEIVIYPDQPDESGLIKLILGYVETPQYLRKYLYKVRPELQYAGTLPPLRTPHHQLEAHTANLRVGEFREGILSDQQGVNVVDIGVEKPIRMIGKAPSMGSRVTVKITETGLEPRCEMARRAEIPHILGLRDTGVEEDPRRPSHWWLLRPNDRDEQDWCANRSRVGAPQGETH